MMLSCLEMDRENEEKKRENVREREGEREGEAEKTGKKLLRSRNDESYRGIADTQWISRASNFVNLPITVMFNRCNPRNGFARVLRYDSTSTKREYKKTVCSPIVAYRRSFLLEFLSFRNNVN